MALFLHSFYFAYFLLPKKMIWFLFQNNSNENISSDGLIFGSKIFFYTFFLIMIVFLVSKKR